MREINIAKIIKVAIKKSHTANQIQAKLHYNIFISQYYETTILIIFELFIKLALLEQL